MNGRYIVDIEVIVTLVLGVAFAFSIGSGDETMATTIGCGAMRLKHAVILAGILAALGAFFLSSGVAHSIGVNLLNLPPASTSRYQGWIMVSILVSVSTWMIVASKTGLPVSVTYCIVGGFIGVAFCAPLLGTDFSSAIHWDELETIVIGWIASPLLGLGCAIGITLVMKRFIRRRIRGLDDMEKMERVFMIVLIFIACFNQLNREGNDAAKALSIFHGLEFGGQIDETTFSIMLVIGSIAIGLGLIVVGRNLLRNVGKNIIEIRPSDAICIETSMSIVLLLANILSLPISGGQVLIFAIVGLSIVNHVTVNKKTLKRIIYSWIVTLPLAMFASAGVLALLLTTLKP